MTVRDYYDFAHDIDRQALDALKAIPGFEKLTKAWMRGVTDRAIHMENMSSKVLLGPDQLPRIYNLLPPICERFGIEEPPLYLEQSQEVNAYTRGDNIPDITLTYGLIEHMSDEEVQIVIAHECGHIVCGHVLYQTMGTYLLAGASVLVSVIPFGREILEGAFYYWMRCSEFSADRAAALFCSDPERVAKVMFRLAGAPDKMDDELSLASFMAQADAYQEFRSGNDWNKVLEAYRTAQNSHPLLAVRAAEIMKWGEQPEFADICKALDNGAGQTAPALPSAKPQLAGALACPSCGTVNNAGSAFCGGCGTKLSPAAVQGKGATSFCNGCGEPLEPGRRFCEKCGSPTGAPPPKPTNSTDRIRASLGNARSRASSVLNNI